MRPLSLLLLILSAPAAAQGYYASDSRGAAQDVALIAGSGAGALAGAIAGATLVGELTPEVVPGLGGFVAGAALGAGVGTHLTGQLVGAEGSLGNAMGDAATAGAIVAGVAGAGVLLFELTDSGRSPASEGLVGSFSSARFSWLLASGAAAVIVPAAWSGSDYRERPEIVPVALRLPTGETAHGLRVRIAF